MLTAKSDTKRLELSTTNSYPLAGSLDQVRHTLDRHALVDGRIVYSVLVEQFSTAYGRFMDRADPDWRILCSC